MPGPDRRCQLVLISSVDSRRLGAVSAHAELLYHKLLLLSDDRGRFWGSAFKVGSRALPARMERGEVTVLDVCGWLGELGIAGLTRSYVQDGEVYLEIQGLYRPIRTGRAPVLRFDAPTDDQWVTDGSPLVDHCPPSDSQRPTLPTQTPPPPPPPTQTETGPADNGGQPDCGEPVEKIVENSAASARRLIFEVLLPGGMAQNVVEEAMKLLSHGRWLGGHTEALCRERIVQIAVAAIEADKPGAFILHMLREDTASRTGPITVRKRT